MERLLFLLSILLISGISYSQVGIGTTTPSAASMLEVSSTSDGVSFGGFMPPRVPDVGARDNINPSTSDVGLLVFTEDLNCLQMWNGSGWEDVHCNYTLAFVNLYHNFDLHTSWGFTSNVPFFDNGSKGFFGVTDSTNGGFNVITTLTNNFLGIMDLNDTENGNGTAEYATLTFETVDISNASNGATMSFYYEFFEYDGGDNAYYTLIIDGITQPEVTLIEGQNGVGGVSDSGVIEEILPPGTNSVSLKIRIKQNGQEDFAGFDNFAIVAN